MVKKMEWVERVNKVKEIQEVVWRGQLLWLGGEVE